MSEHRRQEPVWTSVHGAGVKAVSPAERGRSEATRLDVGSVHAHAVGLTMPPATTTSCGRPESSFCQFLALGNNGGKYMERGSATRPLWFAGPPLRSQRGYYCSRPYISRFLSWKQAFTRW